MPREKTYIPIEGPIKEMPADQLCAILEKEPTSVIMRTIIMNELQYLSVTEYRSLRGFWYSTVKPVLHKLGKLSHVTEKNIQTLSKELSRNMADLVRMGVITYKKILIKDTSRHRGIAEPVYLSPGAHTFGYQVSSGDYPYVVLCTEKNTAIPILSQVASITGCSWLSGSGQNAFSAMEPVIRQIRKKGFNRLMFLSITDHDPAGYSIAETFKQQAEYFRKSLLIKTIHADRLGIFPEQLEQDEIENNVFTPSGKPEIIQKWMNNGGGVGGRPLGLELDAYSPSRLRDVLIQGLTRYGIKPSPEYIKRSYIRMTALETIEPRIGDILNDLERRYRDSVEVEPFDVYVLAEDGYQTLPIHRLCRHDADEEIAAAALAAIGGTV